MRLAGGCAHSRGAAFQVCLGSREVAYLFAIGIDPEAITIDHANFGVCLQLFDCGSNSARQQDVIRIQPG